MTVIVREGMEVKELISEKMCRHHPWDILKKFYRKQNNFLKRKMWDMVKIRGWTISLGLWGKPKSPPNSCWWIKTCNNVACQWDIFFLEKENFLINRRKNRQKVLMFYGVFTNLQKRPVWLTNQRILYWSNTKPVSWDILVSEKQMNQEATENLEIPWRWKL